MHDHPPTILDALSARSSSDRLAYVFLPDGTYESEIRWTFADVAARSAVFAAYLTGRGVGAGSRVVLAVNPSLEFIAALFGIMRLGAIPVPCFPPLRPTELDRFCAITVDCAPDAIVIDAMYRGTMETLQQRLRPGLDPALCYTEDLGHAEDLATHPVADAPTVSTAPDDLALIQYTSGSTGSPKGVCLTHDNLVSNCEALLRNMGPYPDRVIMSWLPPYHDMGLMGTILLTFYRGWSLVLMSPLHFIQEPRLWLKALSDYRAMGAVGPNFSLDLCVDAMHAGEAKGLDLSTVTEFYCGAEPVSVYTMAQFEKAAAPLGFDPNALIPSYGLAEATLFVAGKRRGTRWRAGRDPQPDGDGRVLVSCGEVDSGFTVRIVDPASGLALPDGATGEIWASGRSVAAGYYNREALTRQVFHARLPGDERRYLRTGDLGFFHDGELFITGRIKDLIIVNARNIYPQDVEAAVGRAAPAVRKSVAFSVPGEGSERLVVLAETGHRGVSPDHFATIVEAIRTGVTAEFGVGPDIHLCVRGTIPHTPSGKVRRQEARRMFQSGEVTVVHADRRRTPRYVG